jgi:hypothetical protein
MTAEDRQRAAIIAAATGSYPPGAARALFVEVHESHAAVLLDTGSETHSYPYFVLCRLDDEGRWREGHSANSPGWYQTEDDAGVVVFWGDTNGLDGPVKVVFKGQQWLAKTADGMFFIAWWDELDPGNLIEPNWPEVASKAG